MQFSCPHDPIVCDRANQAQAPGRFGLRTIGSLKGMDLGPSASWFRNSPVFRYLDTYRRLCAHIGIWLGLVSQVLLQRKLREKDSQVATIAP